MRLIDAEHTQTPFCGLSKPTAWLRQQGYAINHKRVERQPPDADVIPSVWLPLIVR